jgi:hypothetical protein
MRNTGNLHGISLELFIVKAFQAALLLITLVIPAGAQTQQKPTAQKPTAQKPTAQKPTAPRPRPQFEVTFADRIKPCLVRPADAVMTAQKNANGSYSGQVDSTRATYANDANDCEYFVGDVIVPEGFKVSGPFTINKIRISGEFSDMTAFTESNCNQASFRTVVYQSSLQAGGSFNERHRSHHEGHWGEPGAFQICYFFNEGHNYLEVDIPEGGVRHTTTYRVLVLPKVNGQPRRARVKWGAVIVPS